MQSNTKIFRTYVEIQEHIIEDHQDESIKAIKKDIFKEVVYHLKDTANKLQKYNG